MNMYIIDLTNLILLDITDSISGRAFGQKHASDTKILEHLNNGEKVKIIIDSSKVKAINDSFIKGFFSEVFKSKNYNFVKENVLITTENSNFISLFEKNWRILNSIFNG